MTRSDLYMVEGSVYLCMDNETLLNLQTQYFDSLQSSSARRDFGNFSDDGTLLYKLLEYSVSLIISFIVSKPNVLLETQLLMLFRAPQLFHARSTPKNMSYD